ncbi:uncharacterized protein LOC133886368 [Phragmites australis]|uniref:uncharacterized protein LOC133886368 n=1 Tax=Phragmites australis TaxID=29695 RepID=UPI002D778325|nr:uncharacterized protein LOC133886368 [Phragmites australis]
MGFNPPVPQRDSNWEIRVAVLLSLVFQVVLIFAGPLRKRSSSAFIRFVIWSCYLLADWVADLALGLLLNNMGNIGGGGGGSGSIGDMAIPSTAALRHAPCGGAAISGSFGTGGGGSPIIFAFWAPFLLLHLGGPDTITAYSLADNELWLRHLIGLLFELSAAAVVFLCSLQGNPMIATTALMFIAGIIKYGERTYSLYSGSTAGFPVSILGEPEVRSTNIPKLMQAYSSRVRAGLVVDIITIGDREAYGHVDYGDGAALSRLEYEGADEVRAYDLFVKFRSLFVNGVISTKNQRVSEAFYLELGRRDPMKAFHILELELNYTYDMLYTKMPVLSTTAGYVLRFVG